jgi:cytochrome c peroxidase
MRRAAVALLGVAAATLAGAAAPSSQWRWDLPDGVAPPRIPADNPMTAAKVELGRRLFYEADLSIDGTMSCATCHSQRHGFADDNRTRPGVQGDPGRRNVPGLVNVAWATPLTSADPRLTTLEEQVAVPVLGEHPVEMGMKGKEAEIARRIGRDACYVRMFRTAFPEANGAVDMITVAKALAAFERTMIGFDTPFDRYRKGRNSAISPAAKRGANLFQGRAGCTSCHGGPNFSDGGFHALVGTGGSSDRGLGEVTGLASDNYKFRTPGLRNVALTPPYMHDGETQTLDGAIRRHQGVPPMAPLSNDDVADLIAFLGELTDRRFVTDTRFALPARACGKRL